MSDDSYQEAPPYKPPEDEESDVMSLDSQLNSADNDASDEVLSEMMFSEDSTTVVETACENLSESGANSNQWEHMSSTTCISEANGNTQRSRQIGCMITPSSFLYQHNSRDLQNALKSLEDYWPSRSGYEICRSRKGSSYHASKVGKTHGDIGYLQVQDLVSRKSKHTRQRRPIGRRACATICAFCGSIFNGPCHKVQALDHIQLKHLLPGTDLKDTRVCTTRAKLCEKSEALDPESWKKSGQPPGLDEVPPSWQDQLRCDLTSDLKDVGTKWQDETRTRRELVDSFTVAMAVAESSSSSYRPDPKTLMDRIHALVNTKTGDIDSERINDFFNGLEVVAHDLDHQRPKDNVSHVIQDIISTIKENAEASNSQASTATQIASTTVNGTKTCTAPAQTEYSGQPSSLTSSNNGRQLSANDGTGRSSITRDSTVGNNHRQEQEIGTQDSRAKHTEGRRLGCPFRKKDEVHGLVSSCSFKGTGAMSAVKIHLTNREHTRDVAFIRHCRNCSGYIIDESEWRDRHENRLCTTRKQSRGDLEVVRQWRQLYEKLFPDSERIPHPYVGNSTWVQKSRRLHQDGNIPRITQEALAFDFNDPHSSPFLLTNSTLTLSSQPVTAWPSAQRSDSASNTATRRDVLFEPSPPIAPYQPGAFHPNTTTYNQAFLDEPLLTAQSRTFRTASVHNQLPSTNIATTTSSEISNQSTSVHTPREHTWSPVRLGPSPSTGLQEDQATEFTSRDLGDDHTRVAVLQTILDLLEAYTRQDSISMSADLAHRVAYVHALGPEECNSMHTDLLARIMSSAEQLRIREAALDVTDVGSTPQPLAAPQIVPVEDIIFHGRDQSREAEAELNIRPLEPWEMGLFTPATQEHVPTWHSDEFLTRLAARSLDELTLPVYVPT